MVEKLIIKNFVGIKDLEIEVKKINILIGPQASGKSICAKLLFYFKNFPWDILLIVENEKTKRTFDSNCSKKFKEYFPIDCWGSHEFFIRYEIHNDMFIEIKRFNNSKDKISINYGDFYREAFIELRKILRNARKIAQDIRGNNTIYKSTKYDSIPFITVKKLVSDSLKSSVSSQASFAQIFIPAGRAFFASIQNNIFSLLHNDNLDPFIQEFGFSYERMKDLDMDNLESIKKEDHTDKKKLQNEIVELMEKSLYGKYTRFKRKDYLDILDRRIALANSSSGQQEILPLLVVLSKLPFLVNLFMGRTVYIEEPEAHIFPSTQRHIIELIATVFNYHEDTLQFFITTHSPYTLTSFNNLLQAGILYKELDAEHLEELEKIVPKYKALSTDDFSAYALANGKCTSIINPETGLIDATIIDSVSEDLMIEFDNLINLI